MSFISPKLFGYEKKQNLLPGSWQPRGGKTDIPITKIVWNTLLFFSKYK